MLQFNSFVLSILYFAIEIADKHQLNNVKGCTLYMKALINENQLNYVLSCCGFVSSFIICELNSNICNSMLYYCDNPFLISL